MFLFGFIVGVLATLVVGYFTVRSFRTKSLAAYQMLENDYLNLKAKYDAATTEVKKLG